MGLLKPFFPLHQSFFGLTPEYKTYLLDEIYLCLQHLKGITYSDVLMMATSERRYYLGLLTKDVEKKEAEMEKLRAKETSKGSKGSRQTSVSGSALKSKLNNGEI